MLDALQHYAHQNSQKRFAILVESLQKGKYSLEHQAVLFSIISRIVTTPADIEFRISLATEFNRLGLPAVIGQLKAQHDFEGSDLDTLIDEYEEDVKEDKEELEGRFKDLNVDFKDAMKLAEKVNQQLASTPAYSSYLGVLREFLGVPGSTDAGYEKPSCIRRLSQCLKKKEICSYDVYGCFLFPSIIIASFFFFFLSCLQPQGVDPDRAPRDADLATEERAGH